MSFYMLISVIPKILNLVVLLKKSRPNKYLCNVDYSFDRQKYCYFFYSFILDKHDDYYRHDSRFVLKWQNTNVRNLLNSTRS